MHIRSVMQDPRAFSTLVNSLKPDEVRATRKEIAALISIEEEKRKVAENDVKTSTIQRDAAKKASDDASNDLSQAQLKLQESKDDIADFEDNIVKQKEIIDAKEKTLAAANKTLENTKAELQKVSDSVANERKVLEKVLALLQKLKNGDAGKDFVSQVEKETKGLVLLSRTSKLLASPSFISALTKADPEAVQRVINLVIQLITTGEKSVTDAKAAVVTAESEQLRAANELSEAKEILTGLEKDLEDEKVNAIQLEKIKNIKDGVHKSKSATLAEAVKDLTAKQTILDNENKRINGENAILLEGEKHLKVLTDVLDVLEE